MIATRFALVFLSWGLVTACQREAIKPAQSNPKASCRLDVLKAIAVSEAQSNRPLIDVEYSYACDGVSNVYISDLGTMPPSGAEHYLTRSEAVGIYEWPGGPLLRAARVPPPAILAGNGPDLPILAEFTGAGERGACDPSRVSEATLFLLNHDHFLYSPQSTDDNRTLIVTAYRDLQTLPDKHLRGQIALMISYPFKSNDAYQFEVRYVARESRVASPDWRAPGQSVLAAAQTIADELRGGIENRAKG